MRKKRIISILKPTIIQDRLTRLYIILPLWKNSTRVKLLIQTWAAKGKYDARRYFFKTTSLSSSIYWFRFVLWRRMTGIFIITYFSLCSLSCQKFILRMLHGVIIQYNCSWFYIWGLKSCILFLVESWMLLTFMSCVVCCWFFQRARFVFSYILNLYYIVYVQFKKIRLLFEKFKFRLLFSKYDCFTRLSFWK